MPATMSLSGGVLQPSATLPAEVPLPPLREELALEPGPAGADGQPSWTLHDPVRHQFFRIDWPTFEVLGRWHLGDVPAIARAISDETALDLAPADVEDIVRFLADHQLLRPQGSGTARALAQRQRAQRGTRWQWLLHHYLFFRVPLVRPDAWLARCGPWVEPLFGAMFLRLTLLATALGLVQVWRDWGRFSSTLIDTFTWQGLAGYGAALVGVKVLHELGHAFAARRQGCRVPVMGVAFLVGWPVAYTDTNEVWKLASRRQRLGVAAAGVATETAIAAWATLAWALLPDGGPKSIAFMLATVTWFATLAVNASPFMRFDGYFVLCDALDMPNLHARSFALARWQLREALFGLGAPAPEVFSRRRTAALIVFAWATWLYRLVVFLGIAVLVYHFAVKALGIVLFAVEIGWFVLRPLWSELAVWRTLAPVLRQRTRARRSALVALALAALVAVPWPARLSSSALLKPGESFVIHAPAGAQLTALPFAEGTRIEQGAVLLELASPDLGLRWQRAKSRLEQLRWQAAAAGVDAAQQQNVQLLQQQLAAAEAEFDSVQAEQRRFRPEAPFAGVLRDVSPAARPGTWVRARERLAVLVRPGRWTVETYLDEDAMRRVQAGDAARFFTDAGVGPALPLTVAHVDRDATRVLPSGLLAAPAGGSVQTREKAGQLVPERAVYRVVLEAAETPDALSAHAWRGHVVIEGRWEAPAAGLVRSSLALLRREAGF